VKILRAEEVASSDLARWGIYAKNGVGKTTFLTSIPPEIPTLVVSADNENVKPLKGFNHIRVVKVDKWDDLLAVYQYLKSDKNKFKCVAMDTWTRMQVLAMNKITGYSASGEDAEKFISQIPKVAGGFQHWQQIGALAAEWMRYFIQLPLHVIFLLQEADKESKTDEGVVETGPMLTPWALTELKESLERVGRMYVDFDGIDELDGANPRTVSGDTVEVRKLLIGKHPRYFGKGNTRKLGYVVLDPTWDKLAASLD
jgi:hypothetical protein